MKKLLTSPSNHPDNSSSNSNSNNSKAERAHTNSKQNMGYQRRLSSTSSTMPHSSNLWGLFHPSKRWGFSPRTQLTQESYAGFQTLALVSISSASHVPISPSFPSEHSCPPTSSHTFFWQVDNYKIMRSLFALGGGKGQE